MLQPIEIERNELGYSLDQVREGRYLRVVHRKCPSSSVCVFLVHGAGGRAGQFKHLIKGLEDRVNVVAFDFLGHGDSPAPNKPELYTNAEHLKDLSLVYNKYSCSRNVLVGHCYGGAHVLRLATQLASEGREGEIAGLVVLCLGHQCVPPTILGNLPASFLEILRPLARSSSNAAMFTPSTDPQLVAFENAISDRNRMYMMKVILGDCTDQELWESYLTAAADVLVSKDIPRVLISGEQDGVFDQANVLGVKAKLQVSDSCCHVISEVGHLPMLEKPDEVLAILKNFEPIAK